MKEDMFRGPFDWVPAPEQIDRRIIFSCGSEAVYSSSVGRGVVSIRGRLLEEARALSSKREVAEASMVMIRHLEKVLGFEVFGSFVRVETFIFDRM